jgi:undecaprenyl diphosphate synthase
MKVNIPNHVAIIPDGNRRWAKQRHLPTYQGHQKGFDTLVEIGKKAREMGIKVLTVWAFSTENWQRSKDEVGYLMALYEKMLDKFKKDALKEEIRIVHLGRKDRINKRLKNKIVKVEDITKKFTKSYLAIALDYGGRDEIIRAINKISSQQTKFTEGSLSKNLDTASLPYPNPDLIIRTGFQHRMSGFMLWQSQYSEMMFVDKYLPDFSALDFEKTINDFANINRRFGK